MTEFFDNKAGAGFNSSFLASKVAGQFATAADSGTGGASRSNVQGHGSGSWHTA